MKKRLVNVLAAMTVISCMVTGCGNGDGKTPVQEQTAVSDKGFSELSELWSI